MVNICNHVHGKNPVYFLTVVLVIAEARSSGG